MALTLCPGPGQVRDGVDVGREDQPSVDVTLLVACPVVAAPFVDGLISNIEPDTDGPRTLFEHLESLLPGFDGVTVACPDGSAWGEAPLESSSCVVSEALPGEQFVLQTVTDRSDEPLHNRPTYRCEHRADDGH